MRKYDGNEDPDDDIAQYKQRMHTTDVNQYQREACMCKSFGSSLAGPALQWFVNLLNGSISSFAKLQDLFIERFSSSRKIKKKSDDLYTIKQRMDEPLRSSVARFNQEKVNITNYN